VRETILIVLGFIGGGAVAAWLFAWILNGAVKEALKGIWK
jgi:hypothetical protein